MLSISRYFQLSKFCALALILSVLSLAHAQQTTNVTPAQAKFFDQLFLRIANLDDPQTTLQRRQIATARQYGLNASETTALSAAIQGFQAGLGPIRNAKNAILAAKVDSLTDVQNQQLAALAAQRANLSASVAAIFLAKMSPQTAARFQGVINLLLNRN
jgi:hypothetical protein